MKRFYKIIATLLLSVVLMPISAFAVDGLLPENQNDEYEDPIQPENATSSTMYGNLKTCASSGEFSPIIYTVQEIEDWRDTNSIEAEYISKHIQAFEKEHTNFADLIHDEDDNSCGEPIGLNGQINQYTCALEGKVVTEINESFAGEVSIGDEARVKTLYKGVCCNIIKKTYDRDNDEIDYECKDDRSVYYDSFSECDENALYCERRQWIIGDSGTSIIKIYIKQIYMWAAGTIGFIAVIIIVINGIRISVSGVTGDITSAKDRIIQAISGLVLLFLSGLLLYTINPTFFS